MNRERCARAIARIRGAARAGRWRGILLAAFACGATPVRATSIGVAMVPPVAFMQLLRDGIERHAKSESVSVRFAYAPEGAGEQQIAQIRTFIAERVDALLVVPVDAAASATITRLAQEADIPLVYMNNGPREDWFAGRVAFVLPNDIVAGRLQMRKLAQMLNGTGRVAIISGHPAHAGSLLRTQGVKEVMAEFPGLHLVAEASADWDRGKAGALVAGWLARKTGIDAIAANNDEMAIGAAEAIEASGLPARQILIGGVDATADGMEAMQRKRLAVTVYQDATLQSRRAVDDALALIHRQPVQQYDWMPFVLVTDRMSSTHFSR